MKHYIASIIFALLISLGMSAQMPKGMNLVTDKVVYLYNTDCKGFLLGANLWNTQASVSYSIGWKVILKKVLDDNGKWDGKTYFITDSVESGGYRGKYRKVFIENTGLVYTDQAYSTYRRDNKWTITLADSKKLIYHIEPSDQNSEWNHVNNPGTYLGAKPVNKGNPVVGLLTEKNHKGGNWIFTSFGIDTVQYIKEKKELLNYLTERAVNKNLLNRNDARNVVSCNDMATVLREIGNVRNLLLEQEQQTKDSTVWTVYIQNPQFDNLLKGWSENSYWYGNKSQNACMGKEVESFNVCQTIEGVPNGLYRLDAQAFYRPGNTYKSWFTRDSDFIVTELYANDMSMPVKSIYEGVVPESIHSTGSGTKTDFYKAAEAIESVPGDYHKREVARTPDGELYPDNEGGASLAFTHGLYDNSLYCLVDSGKLTIGIRQDKRKYETWSAWDNFRLTFFGENKSQYLKALQANITTAKKTIEYAHRDTIDATHLSDLIGNAAKLKDVADVNTLSEIIRDINKENYAVRQRIMQKEIPEDEVQKEIDKLAEERQQNNASKNSLTLLLEKESALVKDSDKLTLDNIRRCITAIDHADVYALTKVSEKYDIKYKEWNPYYAWEKKTSAYCDLYKDALTFGPQSLQDSLAQYIFTQCKVACELDSAYYPSLVTAIHTLNSAGNRLMEDKYSWDHPDYNKACKLFSLCSKAYNMLPISSDSLQLLYYKTMPIWNIGKCLTHLGKKQDALKMYMQSLAMHKILVKGDLKTYGKDFVWTCRSLYIITLDERFYDEAFAFINNWYSKVQTNPVKYGKKENILREVNQFAYDCANAKLYPKAYQCIDYAIAHTDNTIPIDFRANLYDSKGEILLMQGRNAEAQQVWQQLIAICPDFLQKYYPDGTNFSKKLKEMGLR